MKLPYPEIDEPKYDLREVFSREEELPLPREREVTDASRFGETVMLVLAAGFILSLAFAACLF